MNKSTLFTKGLFVENPLLIMSIGICPAIIGAKTVQLGLVLGIVVIVILFLSTTIINLLKKFVSDRTEQFLIIVLTAGFATLASLVIKAVFPELYDELILAMALLSINCILIETLTFYPRNYSFFENIMHTMGTGIGYLIGLILIGAFRELFTAGTIWGVEIVPVAILHGETFFQTVPGGLFIIALIMAFSRWISNKIKRRSKGIWQ